MLMYEQWWLAMLLPAFGDLIKKMRQLLDERCSKQAVRALGSTRIELESLEM